MSAAPRAPEHHDNPLPHLSDDTAPERATIQSIERAGLVLGLIDQNTRALTPALVSERLGLNRTTAHRYLNSLHTAGFLDSAFGLGPLFEQLSAFISGRQQLLTLAPGVMRTLADQTGLSVVLSFLGHTGAVVTLVEEASEGTIILTVRIGTVLELRAAQSRVLLAFQSDPGVVTRMHSALSPTQSHDERTILARVRRDQLAWADLGRAGLASVACPVFGRSDIQAAIGMLGTTASLPPDDPTTEPVKALREASERLTSLLAT